MARSNNNQEGEGAIGYRPEEPGSRMHQAKFVRYISPELKRARGIVPLCKTDILMSAVQVIKHGGETFLHAHTGLDGLWFVLSGCARFYGEGDKLIAECHRHEGVLLPRNTAYWFESVGTEPLEILQVEATAKGEPNRTIRLGSPSGSGGVELFDQRGKPLN